MYSVNWKISNLEVFYQTFQIFYSVQDFLMMWSYLHTLRIKTKKQNIFWRHVKLKKPALAENNKTQIRSQYFKSRPNNNPQTFEGKCFKVFSTDICIPSMSSDCTPTFRQKKTHKLHKRWIKIKSNFKSLFKKEIICHVKPQMGIYKY